MEDLDPEVEFNSAWLNDEREYQNFSKKSLEYYKIKQHKP
jgi:hypothetical protein